MASCSVSLTDHLNAFVEQQVTNGRHQDASDVIREALRRYELDLQAEVQSIAAVRDAIRDGREAIQRGEFTTLEEPADGDALLLRLTRRRGGRSGVAA